MDVYAQDRDLIAAQIQSGTIYSGLESAFAEDAGAVSGTTYDDIAGVDATGTFALVNVWKGTHGVARLGPAP